MLIDHHMFSFRMRVPFQAPFLYMTLSRLLPLIFHLPNFHIIKNGKCHFCFVSPFPRNLALPLFNGRF